MASRYKKIQELNMKKYLDENINEISCVALNLIGKQVFILTICSYCPECSIIAKF